MTYTINNLIIEVTRRCNAKCDHCLRGDARNKDITKETIDKLMCNVDYVGTVTFTGGEPSLNTRAILDFIDICKNRNVSVGSFYIATNGVSYNDDFILAIAKLYCFCEDNEISSLDISRSDFHDSYQDETEIAKLKCFSFFNEKTRLNYDSHAILDQGRAKTYLQIRDRKPLSDELILHTDYGTIEGDLYLNVNGDIIEGCDWSYVNQRYHRKGNVYRDSIQDIITIED